MASKRDVELIIKARDEAKAAISNVTSALRQLSGAQDQAANSAERADSLLGRLGGELTALKGRLDQLRQLRDMARDLDAAARSIDKLEKAAAKAGAGSAQAEKLRQARAEFERLQTAARETSVALGGVGVSQEDVRAATERTRVAIAELSSALRAQERLAVTPEAPTAPDAQATAALRAQRQAVREAEEAWRSAQSEANRLSAAIRATVQPTEQQRAAFLLAQTASKTARLAYREQAAALNQLRGVAQGSFAAFDQSAVSIQREAASARAAVAANEAYNRSLAGMVRNLLGLRAPAQQAAASVQQVATATRNAAAAANQTNRVAPRGGAFAGLRPHELSNLSFQIQDIVVGLASGQRVGTVLLQQGSQILQIGARAISIVAKLSLALAAVGAVVAPFVAAFRNLADRANDIRRFNAVLAATGDAARYSAGQIADTAHELDVMGGSLKEARAALRAFVDAGVAQEQFQALGLAAQNMATVLGVEVPEAAERVAEALTADFEAVQDLDDSINFLTQAERAHIRALFDAGRETEARTEAARIFEDRMDEAAAKSRGPWSEAFRDVAAAWNDVVSAISDSGFAREAGRVIDGLAVKAQNFARAFRVGFAFLTGGEAGLERLARSIASESRGVTGDPLDTDSDRARKAEEDRQLAEAERRRNEAERAAASAAQRAAGFHAGLRQQIEDREFEASLIGKTQREIAVLTALRQAEIEARESGTRVSERELEALQESILLLEQRRAQFEAETAIRESQLELGEARRLAAGRDLTEQEHVINEARQRGIDLTTELGQRFAEVQGEIFRVTQAHDQMEAALRRALEIERDRDEAVRRWRVALTDGTPVASVDVLRERVEELTSELTASADEARRIAEELGNTDALEQLDAIQIAADEATDRIITAQQVNQLAAQGLTGAILSASDALGAAIDGTLSWGDALRSVGNAFRQFAAEFLRRIAEMILQQSILNALSSFGFGGTVSKGVSAVVKHGGGLASSGPRRRIDPSWFGDGVRAYHEGGVAGLGRNEVFAVLKKNEEVLTENDPRHVLNGGGAAATEMAVRIVNLIDGGDFLAQGLSTRIGEKAVLNHVTANRSAWQAALGI
jgi:phage-related minor tail protein